MKLLFSSPPHNLAHGNDFLKKIHVNTTVWRLFGADGARFEKPAKALLENHPKEPTYFLNQEAMEENHEHIQ
jgi:hypothetical protein